MRSFLLPFALILGAFSLTNCTPLGPPSGYNDAPVNTWQQSGPSYDSEPGARTSSTALMRQVNLRTNMMVARGTQGRKVVRPMTPRFITIHSTQNWSAGAERHAVALQRGALRAPKRKGFNRIGFLIWHFTVDDHQAIQHMPVSEQGEHADFDGPGNRYSIGIEMCENRGNNRAATIERTAKLTACLMRKYNIPLSNVVPHYHWPRHGCSPEHKNCPWFLLDNGRPGAKWNWFLGKVNYYYRSLD